MVRGNRRGKSTGVKSRRRRADSGRKASTPRASRRSSGSRPKVPTKSRRSVSISTRRQIRQNASGRLQPGADYETALKNFEAALGYLRKQNYEKAAGLFKKAVSSPVREIAERSRMHLRVCAQKTRPQRPPKTAEESYLRGVTALNRRELDQAIEYLSKSDKMMPDQDHVHYALAAAYALQGDADVSLLHLQKAIELRPKNRVQARVDDDFEAVADDPRFEQVVSSPAS